MRQWVFARDLFPISSRDRARVCNLDFWSLFMYINNHQGQDHFLGIDLIDRA